MIRVVLTDEDSQDLDGLIEYIRSLPKLPGVALGKDLQRTIRLIGSYPSLGPLDPELSNGFNRPIHRRVCRDYAFFYMVRHQQAEVVAILHGKRDLIRIVTARAGRS